MFDPLPHFSADLFCGLTEHLQNGGWLPPAAALLFGQMATFGGSVVDELVRFQLVARSAQGLEIVPTVRATPGLRDYVVYLKLATALAAKAALPIEAKNLLSTRLLDSHSSESRKRL